MTDRKNRWKRVLAFAAAAVLLALVLYLLLAFYKTPYSLTHSFLRNGWRSFLKKEKKKLAVSLAAAAAAAAAGLLLTMAAGREKIRKGQPHTDPDCTARFRMLLRI